MGRQGLDCAERELIALGVMFGGLGSGLFRLDVRTGSLLCDCLLHGGGDEGCQSQEQCIAWVWSRHGSSPAFARVSAWYAFRRPELVRSQLVTSIAPERWWTSGRCRPRYAFERAVPRQAGGSHTQVFGELSLAGVPGRGPGGRSWYIPSPR